jgi:alkaline phosphatase D
MAARSRQATRRKFLKTLSGATVGSLGVLPSIGQSADFGGTATPLQRILFGSCSKDYRPQPLWEPICASQPDLWIWMGDNIYGNADDLPDMAARYQNAKNKPGYQKLRNSCRVIGTWDDNDFGQNDGGKDNPHKVESQKLFLDFIDEPADSPRRSQAGVYAAYTFGPPGRQVKVILLDGRYHRESPGRYADPLGRDQWQWLEEQLRTSTAEINLVGSGIQVLADEHPFEKWSNFRKARERLLDLVVASRARNVIFISGDRHLGEISRLDDVRLGYPLYDITSSGMTHFAEGKLKNLFYDFQHEPNRFRRGEVFLGYNFGALTIDWNASPRTLTMQIRDAHNEARVNETMTLS